MKKYVVLSSTDELPKEVHVYDGMTYDTHSDAWLLLEKARADVAKLAKENPEDKYWTTMKLWISPVEVIHNGI